VSDLKAEACGQKEGPSLEEIAATPLEQLDSDELAAIAAAPLSESLSTLQQLAMLSELRGQPKS
jgi:hypothetical protein